jgi:SAM-dependent methyltransferase
MRAGLDRLKGRWRQEQFSPTWLGVLINPFYFARRGLMRTLGPTLLTFDGDVLDVGCGRKPYRHWTRAAKYVGIDIDTPVTRMLAAADVLYDGKTIPFRDASFDAVICSQVLEHVFWPDSFLGELNRVLRPGGRLVITVPFVWDEHEQPWDFARYSSFGLRSILETAGFEIVSHDKTVPGFFAIVQLASGCVFKAASSSPRVVQLIAQLCVIAPLHVVGGAVAWLLPCNSDLYLDNVVLARKRAAKP